MKKQHSIMQKAIHNLDVATRLFIKDKEYASAILIAGAAEETFTNTLENNHKKSIHKKVKESISSKTGLSEKEINDKYMNRVKNWLKHADSEFLTYDEEEEAIQYILRAISAYTEIYNKIEKTHTEFINYVKSNYKILFERVNKLQTIPL